MAKKVFAVTNVKLDSDNFFVAGTEIDHSKFSKEQLKELHDLGAIEVRTVDEVATEEVTEDAETTPKPEDEF